MSDILEIRESILTQEDLKRDYVSMAAAAELLGVSETTARRWIKEYNLTHTPHVKTVSDIVNGGVSKLYLRNDIQKVIEVFNKDRIKTELIPPPSEPGLEQASVTDKTTLLNGSRQRVTMTDNEWQQVAIGLARGHVVTKKVFFSSLGIGVLIIAFGLTIIGLLIDKEFHRQSRQIASLKSFIAHKNF